MNVLNINYITLNRYLHKTALDKFINFVTEQCNRRFGWVVIMNNNKNKISWLEKTNSVEERVYDFDVDAFLYGELLAQFNK